jgi:hypothetical protein
MAAGVIYTTVTTTTGETVELPFYVDNTVTPTQWTPVHRIDSSQVSPLGAAAVSASAPVTAKSGGTEYETVAASQTDISLGVTGAAGDYIEGLLCVVATAATSQVQIKDGAGSAITVLPNAVGAGVGTYYVPLGLVSLSGAWKVTTAAGVSVIGTGDFT